MLQPQLVFNKSFASPDLTLADREHLWAVVLAGGSGRRLAPLTRQLYGEDRPKQYAALIGGQSLLRQTLGRTTLLIPPNRTMVVTMESHARYLAPELADFPDVHVLAQPLDRGTAAAVLFAAMWIRKRDRGASMVVFPADHFVLDEAGFMAHVADVADYVTSVPRWFVLLGAQPTGPEADYGWIERGEPVGVTAFGLIHRVRCFREKPRPQLARELFAAGGLWNTLVFAASATGLIEAAEHCVPEVHDPLADGRWTLHEAYLRAGIADFSRAVLESPTVPLAVSAISGVRWCDLGSPERVADVLRTFGISPRWCGSPADGT